MVQTQVYIIMAVLGLSRPVVANQDQINPWQHPSSHAVVSCSPFCISSQAQTPSNACLLYATLCGLNFKFLDTFDRHVVLFLFTLTSKTPLPELSTRHAGGFLGLRFLQLSKTLVFLLLPQQPAQLPHVPL